MRDQEIRDALATASDLINQQKLVQAEQLLMPLAAGNAHDVRAIRLLASIANQRSERGKAEALLLNALDRAPDFHDARFELAGTQYEMNKLSEAIAQLDRLLAAEFKVIDSIKLKAVILSRLSRHEEAASIFNSVLAREPTDLASWLMYGHELRIDGHLKDAIAAYREALDINPTFGAAWWALANIKTVQLSDDDVSRMEDALAADVLDDSSRTRLHFALGKAFEDRRSAARSFDHYRQGNALVASIRPYKPRQLDDLVGRTKSSVTAQLLSREPAGPRESVTPIFIVGMPRSGSTLVEQILASHSQIEATWELPYVPSIASYLQRVTAGGAYPANLGRLSKDQLSTLSQLYFKNSEPDRRLGRPFFIDKNPANWGHIGLIRLILPQAKIIDVRRHPMDCGWSNFRQLFASGHEFSYSLVGIAHYYARYVELMAHWDRITPGAIHRVIYEELVANPAEQVSGILGFLGLPFEDACLSFHETRRAIRTPSSEQVQRPLNEEGIGRWKAFEAYLAPLRDSLGAVLDCYPEVPAASFETSPTLSF